MNQLMKDAIQTIERLHSARIDLEVAGEAQGLLACSAEDIELCPPDGPSVYGREAALAHLVEGTAQIHRDIQPSPLRIKRKGVSHCDL
jgi:hypothetical protein